MKTALATLAAISLAAVAMPASAAARPDSQPDTASVSGSSASAAKSEARKTCRRFDNSARRTNAVKLCLTREEWKKFESQQD